MSRCRVAGNSIWCLLTQDQIKEKPQSDFWHQSIPRKLEMCLGFMNMGQTPNWKKTKSEGQNLKWLISESKSIPDVTFT